MHFPVYVHVVLLHPRPPTRILPETAGGTKNLPNPWQEKFSLKKAPDHLFKVFDNVIVLHLQQDKRHLLGKKRHWIKCVALSISEPPTVEPPRPGYNIPPS